MARYLHTRWPSDPETQSCPKAPLRRTDQVPPVAPATLVTLLPIGASLAAARDDSRCVRLRSVGARGARGRAASAAGGPERVRTSFVDRPSRRVVCAGIRQPGAVGDSNEPVDLEVKRDEGVTIRFADGHVARIGLMELRLGCPCATCRSLRERGEEGWPRPGAPNPLRITDAQFHGAYALQITWNDGHRTGLYTFEALRRWNVSGPPR